MDETLVLQAQPVEREKKRALFLIRLSSAFALFAPVLGTSLFLAAQSMRIPDPQLETVNFFAVIWELWLPLAITAFATSAFLFWLAWRAYLLYAQEIRLTKEGVERRVLGKVKKAPWAAVVAEIHAGLTLRVGKDTWKMSADWLGQAGYDNALKVLKERLPKERLVAGLTGAEAALQTVNRAAPAIFAVLMTGIVLTAAYWLFLR